jgi:hypothetical protein
MSNIYDSMVSALREHWKANDNAYPQRFELTQVTLEALAATRKLVNDTMNFKKYPDWEQEFLGVPVVLSAEGDAMIAKDGTRVPLSA